MDLYLIRHAEAAPLGEGGVSDDADRPLTNVGESQARALAAGLRGRGVMLDKVVVSPLLRAHQTAEGMLGQWMPPVPELTTCNELAPGGGRRRLARFLRKLGGDRVAIVGHEPDLSTFAAWLIGSKKARLDLAKAGVACIACEDGPRKGGGSLRWLVSPDWYGPPAGGA